MAEILILIYLKHSADIFEDTHNKHWQIVEIRDWGQENIAMEKTKDFFQNSGTQV